MIAMLVFATPFMLVGLWGVWKIVRATATYYDMQGWQASTATIQELELKKRDTRSGRRRRSGGMVYKVVATYVYEFGGKQFEGQRVALHAGSDGIGTYQHDVYNELQQKADAKLPVTCFVNPQNPAEAVLYRDFRWEMLGANAFMAASLGGVGFVLAGSGLYYWLRQ